MKDENETRVAWKIFTLINRLTELIQDRYEDEFIELHLEEEENIYQQNLEEENARIEPDF